jgi:hypothetical protein
MSSEYLQRVRGKVWFGETWYYRPPRGYRSAEKLLSREVVADATVRDIWVYSSNLDKDYCPTHFIITHWWVIVRDDEGNYWSIENVGAPLVQRVDDLEDGQHHRKGCEETDTAERGTIISEMFHTKSLFSRTMTDVIEWCIARRDQKYDFAFNNCQKFASALTKYLSGMAVLRTPTLLAPAAPVLAPFWKIINGLRGTFG